jgi:hypothetical protein
MAATLLLLLGVISIFSSITILVFNKKQRDVVLERLQLRRRRSSGANTPPRSLSPDKKDPIDQNPSYKDIFPPSRRHTLAEIQSELPRKLNKPREELTASPPNSRTDLYPWATCCDDVESNCFTSTEFAKDEIKALGDFPDYASLSGVPLPQPYHGFDINKARPRPYRPFRWAYHQTMCMLCCSFPLHPLC